MWQEDYYEVDVVKENSLLLGKDSKYNIDRPGTHGSSMSIIVNCHLTRADRVGLNRQRM